MSSTPNICALPSKEQIDARAEQIRKNEKLQSVNDCAYMYNILNRTIHNATISASNSVEYKTEINHNELYHIRNIDIRKCADYDEYARDLDSRGVTVDFSIQKYSTFNRSSVVYNGIKKTITIRDF